MITARLAAAGLTAALATATLTPLASPVGAAPADGTAAKVGTRSLATVLAADGNRFDQNWRDFDVLEKAVRLVLKEKPDSAVGVLADGEVKLTAFIPTDAAFRALVKDLTGTAPETEKAAWTTAKTVGVDTIETILLYHVVVGDKITSGEAVGADGAVLTSAQGGTFEVDVTDEGIYLIDADPDDADPRLIAKLLDINKRNKQIAHGINRVLRPLDL